MLDMRGKACLTMLGDSPLVAETPAHLLDDEVTPIGRMFIRNNGRTPRIAGDADRWRLRIDGEVEQPLETTLGELKRNHAHVTLRLVLECGGNGRSFFTPKAKGNAWTVGGVSCAEWTGVRLADVLATTRLKPSAIYTGHYGADPTLDGRTDVPTLSRGMRIEKALEPAHADRLQAERRRHSRSARRPGPPGRAGLAGFALGQMADADLDPRSRT